MNTGNSSENLAQNCRRFLGTATMTIVTARLASSALQTQKLHTLKPPKRRNL